MRRSHWQWVGLALLGFVLAACSTVEEPVDLTTQSANSDVTFFPGSLEVSTSIGSSTDGFFIIFNNGDEELSYLADVFLTPDVEVTFGKEGILAPGGLAFVAFRATCTEIRLKEDGNGFFVDPTLSNIAVATNNGQRFFPFINTLLLTIRCS